MYDCATRNKELGNFGIKELMLDPKTLLKSAVFERFPLFGMNNVLHGNTLDRLERYFSVEVWTVVCKSATGTPSLTQAMDIQTWPVLLVSSSHSLKTKCPSL